MGVSTAMRDRMAVRVKRVGLACVGGVALACGLGCSDSAADLITTPPADQVFYALRFDQHMITMSTTAPYDTLVLRVVALNGDGTPLGTQPAITLVGGDSAVRVTPLDGGRFLVTGRTVAYRVAVVATARAYNTKRTDTAYVTVTDIATPPRVVSCSVHPAPGDSTVFAPSIFVPTGQLPLVIRDSGGLLVDSIDVRYASSDTIVAKIDPQLGYFFSQLPGVATLSATATIYGVRCADSVRYTIRPPAFAYVSAEHRTLVNSPDTVRFFSPDTVTISVGGIVGWRGAEAGDSLDIHFQNPSLVSESPDFPTGGSDVPPFTSDSTLDFFSNQRFRRFMQVGTYTYSTSYFSGTGTVIVK